MVPSPDDTDTWVEEDRQTYRHPDPEAAAIAGHLAAAGEHLGVHITVDGTLERQP
ncbi:MAG: hypothetical protein WBF20_18370 [Trebonia sp.]|uniref:hypothetical protein n=1 Tax=Trebonia sp. TaxID=2767075 RepID=UPI003C794D06